MAFQQFGPFIAETAGADLSAKQWTAVKYDGTGNIISASVAGETVVGILVDDPKSGQIGTFQVYGVAKMVAGAVLAKGAEVTTDTQGRASTAAAGNYIIGRTLAAASAAGEIVPVLIEKAGYK